MLIRLQGNEAKIAAWFKASVTTQEVADKLGCTVPYARRVRSRLRKLDWDVGTGDNMAGRRLAKGPLAVEK